MVESSPNGKKTLWKKEKLLVLSNFSFFHSVFKGLVLQTCKNQGLFGKGLIIGQSPKNPLVRSSLLGKTWSGQVDYPSLSNEYKMAGGLVRILKFFGPCYRQITCLVHLSSLYKKNTLIKKRNIINNNTTVNKSCIHTHRDDHLIIHNNMYQHTI